MPSLTVHIFEEIHKLILDAVRRESSQHLDGLHLQMAQLQQAQLLLGGLKSNVSLLMDEMQEMGDIFLDPLLSVVTTSIIPLKELETIITTENQFLLHKQKKISIEAVEVYKG